MMRCSIRACSQVFDLTYPGLDAILLVLVTMKASTRVLDKAEFTREGILRKSFFSRGTWRDTAMYSILKEEWKEPRHLPKGNT